MKSKMKSKMKIYTDGASRNNGKTNALAGIGVFFGTGDKRNVSERLDKSLLQTNNVAELVAIQRCLEILKETEDCNQDIIICTDSNYSINCLTLWIKSWKMNNWKNSKGEEVKNRKIIEDITNNMLSFPNLRFKHVFSHTSNIDEDSVGNKNADLLATQCLKTK